MAELPAPRTHNGVTFTPRKNSAGNGALTWDGGRVGGVFYSQPAKRLGQPVTVYGWSGFWRDTFEEGATASIANAREVYENAKGIVLAYEAAQPAEFEGVQRQAFLAGYKAGQDDARQEIHFDHENEWRSHLAEIKNVRALANPD